MVRLITSRLHRCYSRRGGVRSARNERIIDITHLLACTAFLIDRDFSFLSGRHTLPLPPSVGLFGCALLLFAHSVDLYATVLAHNMFYRISKTPKKLQSFISTPTKIDGLVAACFLIPSILHSISVTGLLRLEADAVAWMNAYLAGLVLFGSALNYMLSLPSLDFKMPPPMARAQNSILVLFTIGCVLRVTASSLMVLPVGASAELADFVQTLLMLADLVVWFGSVLNFVRVSRLLKRVQHWASDDIKDKGNQKGLLSWFKSSKSNELSDFDSSDLEDFDSGDQDGDRGASKDGRTSWTRV